VSGERLTSLDNGDVSTGIRSIHLAGNVGEFDRTAGGAGERVAIEIGQLNISAGGLQFDIEFLRNVNYIMHFQAGPVETPREKLVRFILCDDEDFISVLSQGDFVICEEFIRIGFAAAADLAKHVDFELIALVGLDVDGAAVGLEDELAAGCDLKRFFDVFLKVLCQRGCGQKGSREQA
jgi:hypothetical protein